MFCMHLANFLVQIGDQTENYALYADQVGSEWLMVRSPNGDCRTVARAALAEILTQEQFAAVLSYHRIPNLQITVAGKGYSSHPTWANWNYKRIDNQFYPDRLPESAKLPTIVCDDASDLALSVSLEPDQTQITVKSAGETVFEADNLEALAQFVPYRNGEFAFEVNLSWSEEASRSYYGICTYAFTIDYALDPVFEVVGAET